MSGKVHIVRGLLVTFALAALLATIGWYIGRNAQLSTKLTSLPGGTAVVTGLRELMPSVLGPLRRAGIPIESNSLTFDSFVGAALGFLFMIGWGLYYPTKHAITRRI